MNKKLKRLIEDEERTTAKIEDLKRHLASVQASRKLEEDQEIVRSIRTMNLDSGDLYDLLDNIQSGTVSLATLPDSSKAEDTDAKAEIRNKKKTGAEEALESEEINEEKSL